MSQTADLTNDLLCKFRWMGSSWHLLRRDANCHPFFLISVLVKEEHDTAPSGRIAASSVRAAGNVGRWHGTHQEPTAIWSSHGTAASSNVIFIHFLMACDWLTPGKGRTSITCYGLIATFTCAGAQGRDAITHVQHESTFRPKIKFRVRRHSTKCDTNR